MNVCGLSRVNYWHGTRGGMDVHGKLFSEGLVSLGHRVAIISTKHPSGKYYQEINGVGFNYLQNTVFGSRRQGWSRESELKFGEIHERVPVDIIWSQSFDGFGLVKSSRFLEIPIVATLHGSIQQELKTFTSNLKFNHKNPKKVLKALAGLFYTYFVVQRRLLNAATKIITVSEKVTEDLGKWYGEKVVEKCETIPNGVDTAVFKPCIASRESIRNRLGISKDQIVLLSISRLTWEKGNQVVLEALVKLKKHINDVKLIVVGDGNIRNLLEKKISDVGLQNQVYLTGAVSNENTADFYNAADIFLMPTLTVEGMPFVLLEAMACAKPVIASEIGGNAELIDNESDGLLFQTGNANQLANDIIRLIEDPVFRKKLSCAAKEKIESRYSVNRMIESADNLLESVIYQKSNM